MYVSGPWCNGSTSDFDSGSTGSNPVGPTKNLMCLDVMAAYLTLNQGV